MVKNLQIFETGKLYGNMNTNKAFYPENFSAEERAKDFLERRIILGNDKGFDGRKIFMADQCDKTGSYHILTETDFEIKNSYLGMLKLIYNVMHELLNVLAIDEVEKM